MFPQIKIPLTAPFVQISGLVSERKINKNIIKSRGLKNGYFFLITSPKNIYELSKQNFHIVYKGVVSLAKKLKIEKVKKKEKWKLFGCNNAVIDGDILSNAHIEIFGKNEIVIDGCKGVFEYNDTYLKLRLTKGAVVICGSDFNIFSFENSLITVKGKISSLEFV